MLSSRSRYALRALCHLAACAPDPQTTEQVASATGLPPATLSKILQALNQAGIVKTQRGAGGGVELARAADRLNVKDVVDAVDSPRCGPNSTGETLYRCLQRRLQIVMALADRVLKETTVAELVGSEGDQQQSQVDAILNKLAQSADIETTCIQGPGQ